MKKTTFLIAGLLLLGLAALCRWGLAPTDRLPPGWSWKARFVGSLNWADSTGRFLPEKETTAAYERNIFVKEDQRPDAVAMEDQYTLYDPLTQKVIWQYIYHAPVDPHTGAHLSPQYQMEHSELMLSHGICPDCMERVVKPELEKLKRKETPP